MSLVGENVSAGRHLVSWKGRNGGGTNVASGVYFCRLSAKPSGGGPEFVQSKKMILLR